MTGTGITMPEVGRKGDANFTFIAVGKEAARDFSESEQKEQGQGGDCEIF